MGVLIHTCKTYRWVYYVDIQAITEITMKHGDQVFVDVGHKIVCGIVQRYEGGQYVTVKHDTFAGEVFNVNQIIGDADAI